MAAVTRLGLYGGPRAPYAGFAPAAATAALSGTILDGTLTPDRIVAGGETIIVTLTNDTYIDALFNVFRITQWTLITSDGSEPTGWNAEVRDKGIATNIVRTSDTVMTITLDPAPDYAITANETITFDVYDVLMATSNGNVTATPTFTVSLPVTAEATPTGGWVTGWRDYRTYKDEEEKRRERIAMGIIPDDMPKESAQKVIEAAESPLRVMAERKLAELTNERDEVSALRDTLAALLDAYEQDRQQQLREMIEQMEKQRDLIEGELLTATQQQNNATAALMLLALVDD